MEPVRTISGDVPVILAMPHGGTWLPEEVRSRLNDRGRQLTDTDWHIERLYDGLLPGASLVAAGFHRYVIDANRPPGGESLYPGQNTTGLVPLTDFDGAPIWNVPPDAPRIAQYLRDFHAPYHAALASEVARLRRLHGVVLVWDCHSIRSQIPFLFPGRLPDFNIGTFEGASCDPRIAEITLSACENARGFSVVMNGRFKGGWTTRHWGRPDQGIHAVQMELAQRCYLTGEAPPFAYDVARAPRLRRALSGILSRLGTVLPLLKVTP